MAPQTAGIDPLLTIPAATATGGMRHEAEVRRRLDEPAFSLNSRE
jgi:hypothetical protein